MKKLLTLGLLLGIFASIQVKGDYHDSCTPYGISELEEYLERGGEDSLSKKAALLAGRHQFATILTNAYGKSTPPDANDPDYEKKHTVFLHNIMFANQARQDLKCIEEIAEKYGIPLATLEKANPYLKP